LRILKPINSLSGVGSKLLSYFDKMLPNIRVIDLLFHLPINVVNRHLTEDISNIPDNSVITAKVDILKYNPPYNRKSPFSIISQSKFYKISLDFFHANKDYLAQNFPIGSSRVVSGKYRLYNGKIHITHPDHVFKPEEFKNFIEPIYPLTKGITNKILTKVILQSLELVENIDEWQDELFLKKQNFLSFKQSIISIHKPSSEKDFRDDSQYIRRLAYDEFFAMQIALQLIRKKNGNISGNIISTDTMSIDAFVKNLPFKLTGSQNKVIEEILHDQSLPKRMTRLIQGDVGCGKTIVAAIAMLNAVKSGYQVALMAPTSILAKQHFESLRPYFDALNISVTLFTGDIKGRKRKDIVSKISDNQIQVVIGTHALFYDTINFHNLGLVVIDEQHRFGVKQRVKLVEKGYQCDFLLMSATPIPRTLTLTMYGDMDSSIIDEKPEGRKPVDTRVISLNKFQDIVQAIKRALDNNEKIYWVCPLVNESDMSDLSAVKERYDEFQKIFGSDIIAIVHGQMPQEEKDEALIQFYNGKKRLLLATTVIEVGVNVPDATIMIIEHANKFGLAQLHQLRGRVGRGNKQGVCLLLYNNEISATSLERLKVMHDTNDGFVIAEKDLQIRGGGEVMGVRQSGIPNFKIANLKEHYDLLKTSSADAKLLLNNDPDLVSKRGMAVRFLLKIFDYEEKLISG